MRDTQYLRYSSILTRAAAVGLITELLSTELLSCELMEGSGITLRTGRLLLSGLRLTQLRLSTVVKVSRGKLLSAEQMLSSEEVLSAELVLRAQQLLGRGHPPEQAANCPA